LLAVLSAGAVWAVDPNRSISQYVREVWDKNKGFPRGPVYSIEQTKDGYLWI
jgi:ligand-binding sensor domain-containing protein